jgi:hypothetical protein
MNYSMKWLSMFRGDRSRNLPTGKYAFIFKPILRKTDLSSSVIISRSSDGFARIIEASIFCSNFPALCIFAWAYIFEEEITK